MLFVIIGGIFYYKKSVELAKKESSIEQEINSFYDMDEMIVNLDTNGRGNSFVRLRLSLEVKNAESLHILKQYAPKVQDIVQVYVRGLRPDDLRGSISLYNIREQLLLRINKVVYPAQVINIYFRDVLVQ